jgi:hypothetical protein
LHDQFSHFSPPANIQPGFSDRFAKVCMPEADFSHWLFAERLERMQARLPSLVVSPAESVPATAQMLLV